MTENVEASLLIEATQRTNLKHALSSILYAMGGR